MAASGLASVKMATSWSRSSSPRTISELSGPAVRWTRAHQADRLELLALDHGADLARRADLLSGSTHPRLRVWDADGAETTLASARPVAEPPDLAADVWSLGGIISEAGARPIDDHGLLIGEVAGLEVARVVDGDDGPIIELGVGQADRELNQLIHRGAAVDAELRRVIAAVVDLRQAGSHHPLARLGRGRWLRSMILDEPALVDAVDLRPLVPLRPRSSLISNDPSAAWGTSADGSPLIVVATTGVDLDLVPEAADYRQRTDPTASIVLAMPKRDLRLNSLLLDLLPNAAAVAIEPPWEQPT